MEGAEDLGEAEEEALDNSAKDALRVSKAVDEVVYPLDGLRERDELLQRRRQRLGRQMEHLDRSADLKSFRELLL